MEIRADDLVWNPRILVTSTRGRNEGHQEFDSTLSHRVTLPSPLNLDPLAENSTQRKSKSPLHLDGLISRHHQPFQGSICSQ